MVVVVVVRGGRGSLKQITSTEGPLSICRIRKSVSHLRMNEIFSPIISDFPIERHKLMPYKALTHFKRLINEGSLLFIDR